MRTRAYSVADFPGRGWFSYEALKAHRHDLIHGQLPGRRDSSEVDYTVNPQISFRL